MSVRFGREFLSIPGPTAVPDEVLAAMNRQPMEIYGGPLEEMTYSLLDDMKRIIGTTGKTYIYAANGHGAWEAALTNVLSQGDTVLVLESGRFARGWGEMAAMLGLDVQTVPRDLRSAVDPNAVEEALRKDTEGRIKAILVVQVDTMTSVVNDLPEIRRAIDAAGHDALLMVDTIASLATMPYRMDEWRIDVTVAGAQKGLMTPPGLSFCAANDKAKAAHEHAGLRTSYWDWTAREGPLHYQKYCGTPPEHLLFGLRKAIDMLFAEGFDAVFARHRLLAEAVRSAVGAWSENGHVGFNIANPEQRADSVTTVRLDGGHDPKQLIKYCNETCGVVLGSGIGELGKETFRIAHMGYVNAPMVLGTLAATEIGLTACGIAHGRGGAQAAIDYLAGTLPA